MKILVPILLATLILFLSPSSAACSSRKVTAGRVQETYRHEQLHRQDHYTGFRHRGMVFNFLPKGTVVSPSSPSRRHNVISYSVPKGWSTVAVIIPFLFCSLDWEGKIWLRAARFAGSGEAPPLQEGTVCNGRTPMNTSLLVSLGDGSSEIHTDLVCSLISQSNQRFITSRDQMLRCIDSLESLEIIYKRWWLWWWWDCHYCGSFFFF